MATPVHVPRVNNNDDEVKLVEVGVRAGDRVDAGQIVAQVETDKAVMEVEAPGAGFVIGVQGEVGGTVKVGSVLLWLGATADEAVPAPAAPQGAADGAARRAPTAKAAALLREHGLAAADVPASGERLSVADIERYLAEHPGRRQAAAPAAAAAAEPAPTVEGEARSLSGTERGMLATVTWHRDHAVPGYIEIEYDPAPWEAHARQFAEANQLLFSPLLPLMAQRLVTLSRTRPAFNATLHAGKRHEYAAVNVGFTVQAGDVLYLAVLRHAETLDEVGFCQQLLDLQKRAMVHNLGPDETSGATIGFSSMARWKVSRHVPVLPPHTAFMVAHAAPAADRAVLGATYDHRVLSGADVVAALRQIVKP